MKISYYDADDILHIELTGEPIETGESMAPNLHLGYSTLGSLIGKSFETCSTMVPYLH
jgi:uncharacterized protein YuzE